MNWLGDDYDMFLSWFTREDIEAMQDWLSKVSPFPNEQTPCAETQSVRSLRDEREEALDEGIQVEQHANANHIHRNRMSLALPAAIFRTR